MNRIGLISFDVEEWFHVLDTDALPPRDSWDLQPERAPALVARILDLLASHGVCATFFVLGWFARRHPEIVRTIHRAGHEIASHSDVHPLLYQLDRTDVLAELVRGRDVLEQLLGERVIGFRAPGFSIREDNLWALDCVAEAGFAYDSSLFPARRAHGGIVGVPPEPHRLRTPGGAWLAEVPVSTIGLFGTSVPFGGGGYFRLAPFVVTRALAELGNLRGRPLVSYLHPRDFDPQTPRLQLGRWRSFKCYVGLAGAERKLERLVTAFPPVTFGRYLRERGLLPSE